MTYKDKLKKIFNIIQSEAVLEQLIEESGELIQASAKRLRIMRGTNPTPITYKENTESLQEEIADVQLCIDLVIQAMNYDNTETQKNIELTKQRKLSRWLERLRIMTEFLE